jgi:hypothetical protein
MTIEQAQAQAPSTGTGTTRHAERIRRRAGDTLYQISWDQAGNPNVPVLAGPQHQQGYMYGSSKHEMIEPIPQQLSFEDLGPSWTYTFFVCASLSLWLVYLLLPRGFRKQYCHAQRKRYARRKDRDMPAAGYWLPVKQTASVSEPPTLLQDSDTPILKTASTLSSAPGGSVAIAAAGRPAAPESPPPNTRRRIAHPPSPEHPALKKIPPNKIIAETMGRLQGRGIRLVAHGVHCDPKRVWIKLDEETQSVNWQTEFPRRVPNQSGQVSIVLMRGSMHRIALCNILYIDVGKRTNALQRMDGTKVPETTCFSLLTQNGSLDLQANSKLERDALVSCFSMILDDVHEEDWRALYETSPETSLVNAGQGTEVVYHPSDLMVEI